LQTGLASPSSASATRYFWPLSLDSVVWFRPSPHGLAAGRSRVQLRTRSSRQPEFRAARSVRDGCVGPPSLLHADVPRLTLECVSFALSVPRGPRSPLRGAPSVGRGLVVPRRKGCPPKAPYYLDLSMGLGLGTRPIHDTTHVAEPVVGDAGAQGEAQNERPRPALLLIATLAGLHGGRGIGRSRDQRAGSDDVPGPPSGP
jgi:hypothetical protein